MHGIQGACIELPIRLEEIQLVEQNYRLRA